MPGARVVCVVLVQDRFLKHDAEPNLEKRDDVDVVRTSGWAENHTDKKKKKITKTPNKKDADAQTSPPKTNGSANKTTAGAITNSAEPAAVGGKTGSERAQRMARQGKGMAAAGATKAPSSDCSDRSATCEDSSDDERTCDRVGEQARTCEQAGMDGVAAFTRAHDEQALPTRHWPPPTTDAASVSGLPEHVKIVDPGPVPGSNVLSS